MCDCVLCRTVGSDLLLYIDRLYTSVASVASSQPPTDPLSVDYAGIIETEIQNQQAAASQHPTPQSAQQSHDAWADLINAHAPQPEPEPIIFADADIECRRCHRKVNPAREAKCWWCELPTA